MNENKKTSNVMNSLDWYEITKAKKMVKANDASSCGNAIAEYRDNIVVLEHGANFRKNSRKGRMLTQRRNIQRSIKPQFNF